MMFWARVLCFPCHFYPVPVQAYSIVTHPALSTTPKVRQALMEGKAVDFAAPIMCPKLLPQGKCTGEIVALSKEANMKDLRQARKAAAQRDGQTESIRGLGNVDVATSARILVCRELEAGADAAALRSIFVQVCFYHREECIL